MGGDYTLSRGWTCPSLNSILWMGLGTAHNKTQKTQTQKPSQKDKQKQQTKEQTQIKTKKIHNTNAEKQKAQKK